MYGKSFESMYEGSLVGAGMNVFAVWNYIITKARAGRIEVNPKLLAFTLGGSPEDVEEALKFLQRPDPGSRSKLEDGRRIVKEGQFQYRVVNWQHYQRIKTEADRREYNARKQAEYRAAKKKTPPSHHETKAVQCLENGDEEGFQRNVHDSLPDWAKQPKDQP